MITGFGGYIPESEQEPQEPHKADVADNELVLQLLEVLESGLSSNAGKFDEVKQVLMALIEIDTLTGKYTGKVGACLEEIRATVKSRNADLDRSVKVIDEFNPTKMYAQMRETLQVEQGLAFAELQKKQTNFRTDLAVLFDEIQQRRKEEMTVNSQNLNKVLTKQDQFGRDFGLLYTKIDGAIAAQNAHIQEARNVIQATANDLGSLLSQSMKETSYYKKISEQLVVAVFGALALLCITTVLLFFRSPDAATPRVQADFVKKYVQDVDSLETIIKENGYQKRARNH
jgi:hypothetical protein